MHCVIPSWEITCWNEHAQTCTRDGGYADQGGGPCTCVLSEQKKVNFGEVLVLVGDADYLGNWSIENAKRLEWNENNVWAADVEIPPDSTLEYKYAKIVDESEEVLDWSPEGNLNLSTPKKCQNGKIIVRLDAQLRVTFTYVHTLRVYKRDGAFLLQLTVL